MSTIHRKFEKRDLEMCRVFWPVIILIFIGTSACRVEIGLGATVQKSLPVTPLTSLNTTPKITLSATDIVQVEIISTPNLPSEASPQIESNLTQSSIQLTFTPTSLSRLNSDNKAILDTPTPQSIPPAQSPPYRIIASTIDLEAPIEAVGWDIVKQGTTDASVWVVPERAAGWHQNSSLPGHGGNIVLSGHHNVGSEVFRNLVNLKKGDEIILQADGLDYRYKVTDHFILPEQGVSEEQRQQNGQWIMPTMDERLTLVTCWPYNDNSHRLIVIAQ
ncbi:MAG: sortase [Anaerolineales bacterium]|nr:sortase [Anaerolineales bacterium]